MRRTTLIAVIALISWLPASEAAGQIYTWTAERPDGHAPVGVLGGHVEEDGRYQLFYRYSFTSLDGNLAGQDSVPFVDILQTFTAAPTTMKIKAHTFGFTYGITDRLTVLGAIPYVQKEMDQAVVIPGTNPNAAVEIFETSSGSLGDALVSALYQFVSEGRYRAHLHAGVSVPTGSVEEADETPASRTAEAQLPYSMQIGSGTWDVLPGITLLVMERRASLGAQLVGTFRLGDNDRGYTLGNRVNADIWGGYRVNDYLSVSARVAIDTWGDVSGIDPALDPALSPAQRTDFTGGTRVDVPLGINIYFPSGALAEHRLGIEVAFPVHQDLNGPQLRRDWALTVGWEKVY